ncbi:hypothetical protein XJ44_01475 [Thermosipho affectus]|uniref:Type I-D CRISPR-associated protein Cas5/Csc1 n=1 Tax=Thermosipho affectus TaxID=660294 RepID=A0ABX3IJA9_9BACT|nr:type I-D CRISPR-associated protein Cas5/Csc1 [Thermosipho affectus]ONN27905.1 hypothetical protein XJ44_01475 [Thermosipho affectus]
MKIYKATLETLEPLFFATKELGDTYVTEPYISNYSLAYTILSLYDYVRHNIPTYKEDLKDLNVYITPAKFVNFRWQMENFNSTGEGYYLKMLQNNYSNSPKRNNDRAKNIPQIGKLKLISSESIAKFYVIDYSNNLKLPKYIRLGKFNTKCHIDYEEISNIELKEGTFFCKQPLNVLDLPKNMKLLSFKIIPIKPVQIIEKAKLSGNFISIDNDNIPLNMHFFGGNFNEN